MKSRAKTLLDRSIAAMIAAIDVYNKPDFQYRAESFTILALNAWELLLKAKWLADNDNKMASLYVREGTGPKARYRRTRSGNPMTVSIDFLGKKLVESGVVQEACRKNLDALTELRDTSVHLYHKNPRFEEHLLEIGMGCLKNFVAAVQDWFDADLSKHNFYLMPLSFATAPASVQAISLNREEDSFVRFLRGLIDPNSDPAARYAVAINVETRFVRSKSVTASPVRTSRDPDAIRVVLTEEQIRDRYPWDYRELTQKCSERYTDFKENQAYHDLRKPLEADEKFVHVRKLDPGNPKSARKKFYGPAVLEVLDKKFKMK
ncbi:MAG: DUF3644 domain-containing protein [Armatimonadetes bacterium]|nr:DUF3644 domain-containing protein [Armatimonadota bacterium]